MGDEMNTLRIQFNTGRLYQRNGQQIVAVAVDLPDGNGCRVDFHDVSRMISGWFEVPYTCAELGASDLQHEVMSAYDYSRYQFSTLPSRGSPLCWIE